MKRRQWTGKQKLQIVLEGLGGIVPLGGTLHASPDLYYVKTRTGLPLRTVSCHPSCHPTTIRANRRHFLVGPVVGLLSLRPSWYWNSCRFES